MSEMLEKDLTEKGASKDTENVETGALGVLEPEKKIGRSTSNSCYEITCSRNFLVFSA